MFSWYLKKVKEKDKYDFNMLLCLVFTKKPFFFFFFFVLRRGDNNKYVLYNIRTLNIFSFVC